MLWSQRWEDLFLTINSAAGRRGLRAKLVPRRGKELGSRRGSGTGAVLASIGIVSEQSRKFRDRARDCRSLANTARNERDRKYLVEIADELELEAFKVECEEQTRH